MADITNIGLMNRELSDIRTSFHHRRAELWGITLDEIDTVPLTIRETLEYNWRNKIGLFRFRGQWGFCLHVWPGDVAGEFYGPRFSFCDPFPDRMTALESAVNKMLVTCRKSKRPEARRMADWAVNLITPQQLRLI